MECSVQDLAGEEEYASGQWHLNKQKVFEEAKSRPKDHRFYVIKNLDVRNGVLEEIQTLALEKKLYEVKFSGLGKKLEKNASLATLWHFAPGCAAFIDGALRKIC